MITYYIIWLIIGIGCIVGGSCCLKIANKAFKNDEENNAFIIAVSILGMVMGFGVGISLFIAFFPSLLAILCGI